MGHGIHMAAAGAVARRTQLDITANNLANATTTGYRAQRVNFQEVLFSEAAPNRHLVAVGRPMVSWERGAVEQTGRPLDLALSEEGFFVAEGIGGRVLLRSVSVQLDPNGVLKDTAGRTLRLAGGDAALDPNAAIEVTDRGQVRQDGREVARLLMVNVPDQRGLSPVGLGGYVTTLESGAAFPISAEVVTGALEKSNVNPVTDMVRMLQLERDFQSLTRVIHAYREADEGVIDASQR